MVGQTISHYKVLEKLGEGGMGEVYLAEDTTLNRRVALKLLPEPMREDEMARKRFLREAQSAANLDHPYVCHVHEIGRVEGRDFIAMEFVAGETLQDRLKSGPMPLEQALQIASEVAEALEEAHNKSIVHRDVKPSNIMLTQGGHAKVMDFGLAKRVFAGDEAKNDETLTELTTVGTVSYMSPEQVRAEEVDARSDIFSFGIVLYEMLTGIHPFRRGQEMVTASAILNEDPPPLSEHEAELPGVLQHTIRKMLTRDPAQRYQSIHEVRTNLNQLIQEMGSSEFRQGSIWKPLVAGQFGVHTSRERLLWIAVSLGLLLALAATVFYFQRAPEAEQRASPLISTIPPPENWRFESIKDGAGPAALSPDGRRLAFLAWDPDEGKDRLWVRSLEDDLAQPLAKTEGASYPFWSPDSRSIGFFAG